MSSGTDQIEIPQTDEQRAFADIFRPGLTKQQVEFLEAYIHHASLRAAAKESGHEKARHYEWLRSALYFECFKEAQRQTAVALESEAMRRAVEGVPEPIYSKDGKLVGHRRKFSDSLLLKLLEANNPEKFKVPDKKNEQDSDKKTVFNVYLPTNGRGREPVEGEPETIPMKKPEQDGSGGK